MHDDALLNSVLQPYTEQMLLLLLLLSSTNCTADGPRGLLLIQTTCMPCSPSRLTCIGCAAVPKRAKRQPKGKARPGKAAGKDAKAPAKPPPAHWAESEGPPLIPVMQGA